MTNLGKIFIFIKEDLDLFKFNIKFWGDKKIKIKFEIRKCINIKEKKEKVKEKNVILNPY